MLQEAEEINRLLFKNNFNEVLHRTETLYILYIFSNLNRHVFSCFRENRSFYHSLCHSTVRYLKAAMTFDQVTEEKKLKFDYNFHGYIQDDIQKAIQALRHTVTMAKKYEPYRSWIPFGVTGKVAMNECEISFEIFIL